MKVITLFASLLLSCCISLSAQSLDRQVIGSAGGDASNGNVQLSSTTGEAVVATTPVVGNIQLTQGFQQPDTLAGTSAVRDDLTLGKTFDYIIYPVPASDVLNIELTAEGSHEVSLKVLDMTGAEVLQPASFQFHESGKTTLDVQRLASGRYLIMIQGEESMASGMFEIIR